MPLEIWYIHAISSWENLHSDQRKCDIFFLATLGLTTCPSSLPQSVLTPDYHLIALSAKVMADFFEFVHPLFCSTVIAESAESAKTAKHPQYENEKLLGF